MLHSTLEQLLKRKGTHRLSTRHLVSIDHLSLDDIMLILDIADIFSHAPGESFDFLKNRTVANVFFENSTRTKLSFELAAKKLGAEILNISATDSSVKKGESALDTCLTLHALGIEALIIRTAQGGLQHFLSPQVPASLINAGDGCHEHPSQGFLDAKTMRDHHGNLKGKVVTVVGDILHSRVFGSLRRICQKLGAKVRVAAPLTFLPKGIEHLCDGVFTDIEKGLKNADVVYALRVQEERGAKGYIPSLQEYSKNYLITPERFALARKDAILMHPGPVIRGTDIASPLMNHERCKVLTQVKNGVFVRMAILWLLLSK